MSRTRIDFSNHQLEIVKNEHVTIHTLHKENSSIYRVVFINCKGILSVTGDFGNWIFCREFHPLPNAKVSDSYWNEKLRTHSEQTYSKFDTKATLEEIQNYRQDHEEYLTAKEEEWLENLEYHSDDELEYTHYAYIESHIDIDYEDIPFGKKQHASLNCVYDAFEAICEKLNN